MNVGHELVKTLHELLNLAYFWCACWVLLSIAHIIVRVVKD